MKSTTSPLPCLIVTGGPYALLPETIKNNLSNAASAPLVIACDSGYQNAIRLGLTPAVIIGDFDSAPRPACTEARIIEYPTRKDDTDTMLAVRYTLENGYKDITIACALGGRVDHAYANIQTGTYIAGHGGCATLLGEGTEIVIFGGTDGSAPVTKSFPTREHCSLSVFSMTDRSDGVTITGTKYEVKDATLTNTFPIGASNVWTAPIASITVCRGILMVVQSRLDPNEHI